ncbi:MAG: ferrochelatase [Planctomycetes bacterium]|nr:ferrochelatase [Planctomycetota bacterium]
MQPRRTALLVNLGTPREPTASAVREFLAEFLSDPLVVDWPAWLWQPVLRGLVLRSRPARVAEAYASIWTAQGSPLAAQTCALAEAVQRELGATWEVRAAFRYGRLALAHELASLRAAGREVHVLPLFPQRTQSSSGSIEAVVARAGHGRLAALEPADAGYVASVAAGLAQAPREARLLVSFHSIPRRVDRAEGARYSADCRRTFEALLAAASWPREQAELCFQSRFGPEPWLGPQLAARLTELPRAGVRSVCVVTPGFLTEGLETLEEVGIRARETFLEAGGTHFERIRCPAGQPELARALARVLEKSAP